MQIKGYKAFNKDRTNRYGKPFVEGEDYHIDGPISFGNHGNGFHMCKHLSDVFRFFKPEDIEVARVTGSGEYVEGEMEDWIEPYYDMYSVSDIHIDKFLTREEIIDIMIKSSTSDVIKFFATFNPTDEEALLILRENPDRYNFDRAVAAYLYYLRKVNVYTMDFDKRKELYKGVLSDGQDYNQGCKGK